ncbi:patatin-like phospholipase family protein [Gordonia insulae]|uniref:Putative NTE family protein n=1 Tax=Gordonia insulae TaxID=2420509 RepID=A0A3G8JJR4_9ACTN|nr:patatin-like phospholipase family protein [Gordonia insulae]AZG45178.1 putative NTE family protein [Gordonia insulae]
MARSTRVALALGSGGARGYAHIGVIAELEDRGFEIVTVAGSSMGALVGGLHCAGKLDEYVDWVTGLSQLDVVRLMDVSLSKSGVIGAERILTRVREILDDIRIEDLRTPFTAVATDLNAGRAVWFQRDSLVDAIRASIAIPGVISPHEYDGRLLGDGGILDPLPVAPTSAVTSDVTIGVVLGADGGPDQGATREPKTKRLLRRNVAPILDSDFVRSVRDRFGMELPGTDDAGADAGPEPAKMGRIEVLSRSLDIMQEALTRYQVAGYPPDILIRIPRKSVRTLDFHKGTEMIAIGRSLTAHALDQLPELTQ